MNLSCYDVTIAQSLQELQDLLDKCTHSEHAFSAIKIHGLVCAVLSGPQKIPLEQWLPTILGRGTRINQAIQHRLVPALKRLSYRLHAQLTHCFPVMLPSTKNLRQLKLSLRHWCEGYLRGVYLAADSWLVADLAGQSIPCPALEPLLDLADQVGVAQLSTQGNSNAIFNKQALHQLPEIINTIYQFWHLDLPLRRLKPAQQNCLCGSKKPFDRCCLH